MQLPDTAGLTINTKFTPPKQRHQLLKRERLMRDMALHRAHRLILITAPAGYGKTSLLGQVLDNLAVQWNSVSWISIDPDDNDLMRFFVHLRAAVAAGAVELEKFRDSSDLHLNTGYVPQAIALKAELLNLLSNLKQDLYLFFDDFHLIDQPDVLELVSAMLLAPLERLHVVVAARHIPTGLPISRLRALGELHEIRAQDLAFSSEETAAFIRSASTAVITPDQVGLLQAKTEGWIASLQLATFAMQGGIDTDSFISNFNGADRDVSDFLMDEVLKTLSDEMHEFLIATSLLGKFSADLANAVLRRGDSRLKIDLLESKNLFIFSLDRERAWYRYHHLFTELLKQRLLSSHHNNAMEYHRRASVWLEQHGLVTDAIRHSLECQDLERVGKLLDATSTELFATGQLSMLNSFASRLPTAILNKLPRLQLELAWTNEIQWRFEEARDELSKVRSMLAHTEEHREDTTSVSDEPDLHLHAKLEHRNIMLKVFTDDLREIEPACSSWIERFGHPDHFMSASISTAIMLARREHYACDAPDADANEIRRQLIEAGAVHGNVFLETVVGGTWFMRGDLGAAERSLRQAREQASRLQGAKSPLSAMPSAELAHVLYEKNHLDEARTLLHECGDPSPVYGVADSVIARQLTVARLSLSSDDPAGAHAALDAMTQIADRYDMARLHAHVLAERIRILLAHGELRQAETVASSPRYQHGLNDVSPAGYVDTTKEQFAIASALLEFERGNVIQAITLLRRWIAWTQDRRCLRSAIRLSILLSSMQQRTGDVAAAHRSMLSALQWGSRGPFIRSFLDEGPSVLKIVSEVSGHASLTTDAEYYRLLHSLSTPDAPSIQLDRRGEVESASTLSSRERQILELTSRNLSSDEIATALGLAQSTIKWYWRKIFEKLGVHRRTVAVRLARQRGIIP